MTHAYEHFRDKKLSSISGYEIDLAMQDYKILTGKHLFVV